MLETFLPLIALTVYFLLFPNEFHVLLESVDRTFSSIYQTVSIGSALALSMLYVGSLLTSPLLGYLVIFMWIFAAITHLFPRLHLPPHFSIVLLVGSTIVAVILHYKNWLDREKEKKKVAQRIAERIKIMDHTVKLTEEEMEENILTILNQHF